MADAVDTAVLTVEGGPSQAAVDVVGGQADAKKLGTANHAALAAGELRHGPIATEARAENLDQNVVRPESARFTVAQTAKARPKRWQQRFVEVYRRA